MTFGLSQPPEYLHALLNHLPIVGLAVALLALGIALLSKHRTAVAGSLLLVGLFAASVWPVIESGESAYDRIRSISDPEAVALLKRHMLFAARWAWLYYVTAAAAMASAFIVWKRSRWQNWAAITVAIFAAGSLGVGAAVAKLGGQVRHAEFRPGSVPVHVSSAPVELFGRDLVVSLFRDVTEFKTLQAELLHAQRLESVGALASGIAHDLNNALTPILFATDLLRVQPQGTNNPRLLDTVGRSAARASQIVRQMLAFVRGGESQRADVQLRHLVREAADLARVAFPKSIQIHEHVPGDLWTVKADSGQLAQVLMNLAVNARDAMPGGGALTFSAENLEVTENGPHTVPGQRTGSYVVLTVADTGSGIPPEILDKIFDPFFTTKPVGKGTGLGLAITRDIVANHNGFVQVVTHPGQGTKFRIYLPATLDELATPAAPKDESRRKGHGELVLIADDETFILEMTQLALETAGYRVLQAHDGTEAVALAVEHKGDLQVALIDLRMPFLDGIATIRALHKINPSLKIVRMSGVVDATEKNGAENIGEQCFLQKPFSAGQLLDAVDEALRA